ncbi:proline--tRNA ligase [archaeon]|nr:proline--tRNA ligase [archaeon]
MTFYDWYNEHVRLIVDNRYKLKGALVWTPYGFKMQRLVYNKLRALLESTGHQETRFPLMIPETQLQKEKEHVKGFNSEVYWVTHGGSSKLEEKLALRPTSETVIYPMFALWIRSHADLPLKIFQIVNTFRYETKHTRPLIRDREITFFKEAHCAHANQKQAQQEMDSIEKTYKEFFDALCTPYYIVKRPAWDRFPGAEETVAFDQVMPNGKTLQIATSHNLGTGFSKMFEITYEQEDGSHNHPVLTCHGISGRCIAGLISAHGDERGLVLPPEFAPVQIAVVPVIFKNKEDPTKTAEKVFDSIKERWRAVIDKTDETPGAKYYRWEQQGVPIRVELGPREVKENKALLVRRDTGEKKSVALSSLDKELEKLAKNITETMHEKAWEKQKSLTKKATNPKQLKDGFTYEVEVCSEECAKNLEEKLEYRGNIVGKKAKGKCIACGKPAKSVGLMSNAY